MCAPQYYGTKKQSAGPKVSSQSMGGRLDKAQRDASSTAGGGTFQGRSILAGVPRHTDAEAIRKTTLLGV